MHISSPPDVIVWNRLARVFSRLLRGPGAKTLTVLPHLHLHHLPGVERHHLTRELLPSSKAPAVRSIPQLESSCASFHPRAISLTLTRMCRAYPQMDRLVFDDAHLPCIGCWIIAAKPKRNSHEVLLQTRSANT